MSSIVVIPAKPAPVLAGRLRWAAGTVLVAGGALQVAEFLLESAPDDNAARVATWVADPTRIGLSVAAGVLAVPFLLAAVVVLVALTRPFSPRLAWTGGAFMTLAMTGLAVVHGVELAAYGLVRGGDPRAAVAVLNAGDLGTPGPLVFVMFLAGAVLGTATLAAAMFRSPAVPIVAPVLSLAFAALDFAAGWGVAGHLVNLAALSTVAYAVVTGYARRSRESAE